MKNWTALDIALRQSDRTFGHNILRVASAVQDGETVTFGTTVFEVDFSSTSAITAGRQRVNLSASPTLAAASKTGTFSGVGSDGDTIVVDATTYTLKTALSSGPAVANEVLIGGSAGATRDNLVAAINAAAGAGTTYGTGTTANASVTAAASSTADIVLTAKAKGTVGNSIAISETGTGFSFAGGATALSGGVDATAAEFTTALAALSVENVAMTRIGANEVLFADMSPLGAVRSLACTDTLAGSNNAWASATTYGYRGEPEAPRKRTAVTIVPNATEVALGSVYAVLTFTPRTAKASVKVTSGGAVKAWGGTTTITGNTVRLTNNTVNDFAATDTITLEASE